MAQQILVIHGGDTFDTYEEYLADLRKQTVTLEDLKAKNWKGGLSETLGEGFEILAPRMPNAQNAKYSEWKIWFEKITPLLGDNVILVGHSLGGIFLAKYLSAENFPVKIKATFLVAAPHSDESVYTLGDFRLPGSLQALTEQAGEIFLYHSRDDQVVLFSDFEKYQQALPEAKVRIFEDRQHFSQEELPEIIDDLRSLTK